jgi:ubiquinone biosynthesis protein COQ4
MSTSILFPHFDILRAGRAIGVLLSDPDDLPSVFTVIDALDGTAPHRLYLRMRSTPTGARLLRERPDIVPRLADRAALAALPGGSLGRAYLAFVEREGISAEGIRDASVQGAGVFTGPAGLEFVRRRARDTHDLWHAVTGYHGDVAGELGLLAFTLAQHWNTGVAVILGAAIGRGYGRDELGVIRDGWRRGRAASWLYAQDWEALLPLPLDEVRARLKLGAPPVYKTVRTDDLRAAGLIDRGGRASQQEAKRAA